MKKILALTSSLLLLSTVSCSAIEKAPNSNTSSDVSETNNSTSAKESEYSKETNSGEDIVLTMVVGGDYSDIQKEIDKFNKAENGYQIVTKKYYEAYSEDGLPNEISPEEKQTADFNLVQDIINKDEIDIVCSRSFVNEAKYEIMQNKGAFVDLYSFMENDNDVNRNTLDQHILSLKEIDGKLYSLPSFYQVTTLVGETKYVGDKENWSVDDFIAHWEQMPADATINGSMNSENVYYTLLRSNLVSFVDYDNAKVHFNSPEFREILEFCNRFDSNNGQKSEYYAEAPNFVSEYNLTGIMSSLAFGDNATVFSNNPSSYTMVGYPSSDGNGAFFSDLAGCYSICASSSPEKQRGAWEFIRTFATEDYQVTHVIDTYNDGGMISYSPELGICVNNNAFEVIKQDIFDGKYYSGTYVDKDIEYSFDLPDQDNVNAMKNYLKSVNRWQSNLDDSIWQIVNDEVMSYLHGEKSLDDTIGNIQSRASIWVSEQS